MKRVAVVTGGAGFIGSSLVKKLEENNYKTIIYDDFTNASGQKNIPKGVKIVRGSVLNFNKFKTVCKNANVVFNLAVKPLAMSFDKPDLVVKVNDYGTYLVAKACTELNFDQVFLVNDLLTYARSTSFKKNYRPCQVTLFISQNYPAFCRRLRVSIY